MTVEQKQNFFSKPINLYYMLIFSSLGLSLLGLVMVFSASSIHSLETKGTTFAIVLRQFIFLLISIPMAWVLSRFSLNRWKDIARLGVVVSFGLLAIVD
jgi:cell division protein FtsW